MKLLIQISSILLLLIGTATTAISQEKSKWSEIDKSPLDMAYYPAKAAWRNYLKGEDREIRPKMRITYSRPSMKGRTVFGNLVPYGQEWRLGANESTLITFYNAVDLNGTTIQRGNYTLSATPEKDHWNIHVSTQTNIWGSEKRDQEQTVATIKVNTETMATAREELAMAFQRVNEESANLVIEWETTKVVLPIGLNPVMFEEMDKSPMDQAHYPANSAFQNYLNDEELKSADPLIKVIYGRPQKKDRKIFGELLEYGKIWRVGANESTEISIYKAATINGTAVKAGTYNLYAMVNENSWDLIFSTDRPAWGAANRDESKDAYTINIPVTTQDEDLEVLNIIFEEKGTDAVDMIIAWEKHIARIPFKF